MFEIDLNDKTLLLNQKHNLTQSQIFRLRNFRIILNDFRLKSKFLPKLSGELLVETNALYGKDKKSIYNLRRMKSFCRIIQLNTRI